MGEVSQAAARVSDPATVTLGLLGGDEEEDYEEEDEHLIMRQMRSTVGAAMVGIRSGISTVTLGNGKSLVLTLKVLCTMLRVF